METAPGEVQQAGVRGMWAKGKQEQQRTRRKGGRTPRSLASVNNRSLPTDAL
jgi:hypothetical protein